MKEKIKKIVKVLFYFSLLFFLVIYLGQMTGYYKVPEERKVVLTDEAMERFEEDVKNGKEIIAGNYLEKENNYNNNLSLLGVKLSKLIENGFNKLMWLILNELESVIDS